jgi:tetratricopeptide (TPR) repeat protein
MDHRLDAGRQLLGSGEQLLRKGDYEGARGRFEAALSKFRGPELRLGEAHALRGIARVDLNRGQAEQAEVQTRDAVKMYSLLHAQIDGIGDELIAEAFRHDAHEGEALSYVLLGDVLVALGQHGNARAAFERAKRIFSGLGEVSSSGIMWASSGRLAMRDGRYQEARDLLSHALATYEGNADLAGQASVLLSLGELSRMQEQFDGAELELGRVAELAQTLKAPQLEGQAVTALGALNLQLLRLEEADGYYSRALEIAQSCDDTKLEAYVHVGLGEVQSRANQPAALRSILLGAQGFARLGNEHGMGAAMLRLGQHCVRSGRPVLGLVAAEAARRLWRRSDPVRGVGQALRIIVKALAAVKRWEALLAVSKARVVIAGELQPNAYEVYEFYTDKAPESWIESLNAMDDKTVEAHAEERINAVILDLVSSEFPDGIELGTIRGSMATIEQLLTREDLLVDEASEAGETQQPQSDESGDPPQERA